MAYEKIEGFDFINPECKYIFVGSSTTKHSRAMGFPYMNQVVSGDKYSSVLWTILGKTFISDKDEFKRLESLYRHANNDQKILIKEDIKKLLKKYNIGLIDMVSSCWFDNDVGDNSDDHIVLDDDEHPIIFNNVKNLKNKIFIINGSLNPRKNKKKYKLIKQFCALNDLVDKYEKFPNIFASINHEVFVNRLKEIMNIK